jgi:hypothetical protein
MIDQIQVAVGHAWDLLFAPVKEGKGGVVMLFIGFLQANPIFLLPLGLYLVVLGMKTTRKLITGF